MVAYCYEGSGQVEWWPIRSAAARYIARPASHAPHMASPLPSHPCPIDLHRDPEIASMPVFAFIPNLCFAEYLLIVVMAPCFVAAPLQAQGTVSTSPPAPVVAQSIEQRDIVIQHTFVGTVTPTRTSLVGSPVEGQVIAFHVQEGDFVRQGDKLAQLRLRKLEIQFTGRKRHWHCCRASSRT